MSNVTLDYARPIFEEHQKLRLTWSMHTLFIATAIIGATAFGVLFAPFRNPLIGGMILVAAVMTLVVPYFVLPGMTTRVDGEGVHLRFGTLPWRTIAATTITTAETCAYNAFKEFGGYGMRLRQKGRDDCYTISGDQGVRLTLQDGRKVLIGTQRRDELAAALRTLIAAPS